MILERTLWAVGLAVAGAFVAVLRPLTHRQLCALISAAAGTLLVVTFFDLAPEAAERLGWPAALVGGLTGYALFALISRYVAHVCPACAASHTETFFHRVTVLMIVALSIHSVLDGVAIAASAGGHGHFGPALLAAVLVHKVPEGLALTAVALGAGWSRARALILTALVEALTVAAGSWLGVVTGVDVSPLWTGWVLAHIGGGFLFLAIHATRSEFRQHPRATALAVTLGAAVLWVLRQWLGGGHAH